MRHGIGNLSKRIGQQREDRPTTIASRPKICLALSGGGFRAALFHLGVLRRLNEVGLLSQLDHISSVSGGSIIAAHIATAIATWPEPGKSIPTNEWNRAVAGPIRVLCSRNIRTGPLASRAFLPWNWFRSDAAARHLARKYDRFLFHGKTLTDLPRRPKFEINATELLYGIRFFFTRHHLGCYMAGRLSHSKFRFPLALAVAASSCFPPVFRPIIIARHVKGFIGGMDQDFNRRQRMASRLALSDGGVYDNLGLEPIWARDGMPGRGVRPDAVSRRTFLLISDGGATIKYQERAGLFGVLNRYIGIPLDQVGSLRRRWVRSRNANADDPLKAALWSIDTDTSSAACGGYGPQQAHQIAGIRTDLDAFSDAEMAILENQGYLAAECNISQVLTELALIRTPLVVPWPEFLNTEIVSKSLHRSHRRVPIFGRFRLSLASLTVV